MKLKVFFLLYLIAASTCRFKPIEKLKNWYRNYKDKTVKKFKDIPPFQFEYFILYALSRSGLPVLHQVADVILFVEAKKPSKLVFEDKYPCNKEGIKRFYEDSLNSVDFLYHLNKQEDEDPVESCRETKKKFKTYKNAYEEFFKFQSDERSPSEIANIFDYEYPKIRDYLIKNSPGGKTWLNSIITRTKKGIPIKNDRNIKNLVLEKVGGLPERDEYESFRKFFKKRKCQSLRPTGIFSRIKNKIAAATTTLKMIDFCSGKVQTGVTLLMDITHYLEKIISIVFHISTSGGTFLIKVLLYSGLIAYNLFKAYKAAKKSDGKEMSARLGQAVGYVIKMILHTTFMDKK